jgi:ankyrin repeat protein
MPNDSFPAVDEPGIAFENTDAKAFVLEEDAQARPADELRTNIRPTLYLPLHSAVESGKRDIVELLLAQGAAVDGRGVRSWEMTALQLAADLGLRDIAELLLDKGADINAHDASGSTPLSRAVGMRRMAVIQLLVAKGVNIYASDGTYDSLLGQAMREANFDRSKVVDLLLAQKGVAEGRTSDAETALHLAASSGNRRLVEFTLALGININARDDRGLTPLHNAAIWNSKDAIELLLAHGATLEARDNDGRTPLHNAAGQSSKDVIELLLAHGANLEARDNDGRTPLDYAALWEKPENFLLLRAKIAALPFSADAESAIEQGIAAAKKSDYLEAIRLFEIVQAEAPYSPLPLYYLGLAESKIPDRELRAICWFKAFLAAASDSPKAEAVGAEIANLELKSRDVLLELIKTVSAAADLLPEPPANEPQDPDGSYKDFNLKSVALLWARAGDADAALARAGRINHPLIRTMTAIELARPLAMAGDLERGLRVLASAVSAAEKLERSDDRDIAFERAATALADLGDGPTAHNLAARIEDAGRRCQALWAIARAQANAGNMVAATKTTEAIPVRYYRSAAQASIARVAAETGDRTTAAQLLELSRASLGGVAYDQNSVYDFSPRAVALNPGRRYFNLEAAKRGIFMREYEPRPTPVPPQTVAEADQQSFDVRFLFIDCYIAEGLIRDLNMKATRSYLKAGQTQAVLDLGIARARLGNLKGASVIYELRRESDLNDWIDGRWKAEMLIGIARGSAQAGDLVNARMLLAAARSSAKPKEYRIIDEAANSWIAANEYLLTDTVFTSLPVHLQGLPQAFPQQTFWALAETTRTLADAQSIIFNLRSPPINP